MSSDATLVELEAEGETIGEAKWQALRELERVHPGLDRDSVAFEVLTEGERGLLGVGTSPARVLARVDVTAPPAVGPTASEGEPQAVAELARAAVERIAAALGVRARVVVVEDDDEVRVSASAPEIGLLIGRDGRTIDAVQHVVSTAAYRAQGAGGKRVEVDAGGYRERRQARLVTTAKQAAERALASGVEVRLEAMTPPERKSVHTALQDTAGIETHSEGDEPNRFVVVTPAAASPLE